MRPIPGAVIHRSQLVTSVRHPTRSPPQTRIEATVLDLAETARTLDQALMWVVRACARRLTTVERLRHALAGRKAVRWRRELAAALGDVADGCHSMLEMRYLRRVERPHGLPRAYRQVARVRRGGRWYDDVR